jgi:adenylosuccinate lyase
MENVSLWHERDLTHSSVERVIIPDSCILLDYMLEKFTAIVQGLVVYEDRMQKNIERTRGLVFSQELMLVLVGKGLLREEAYRLVQGHAMTSWTQGLDFRDWLYCRYTFAWVHKSLYGWFHTRLNRWWNNNLYQLAL